MHSQTRLTGNTKHRDEKLIESLLTALHKTDITLIEIRSAMWKTHNTKILGTMAYLETTLIVMRESNQSLSSILNPQRLTIISSLLVLSKNRRFVDLLLDIRFQSAPNSRVGINKIRSNFVRLVRQMDVNLNRYYFTKKYLYIF